MLTLEEKQFVNNYLKKVARINTEELVKEAAYAKVNDFLTKTASENSSYLPSIAGAGALGLGGYGAYKYLNSPVPVESILEKAAPKMNLGKALGIGAGLGLAGTGSVLGASEYSFRNADEVLKNTKGYLQSLGLDADDFVADTTRKVTEDYLKNKNLVNKIRSRLHSLGESEKIKRILNAAPAIRDMEMTQKILNTLKGIRHY